MIILAIETTEKFGSVALLDNNQLLAEISLPKDQRSSQTLHPALHALLEDTQTNPSEIDVVAVVAGPGAFTGLRLGVTAAKVLAYVTGAKIMALDTFQTVAFALSSHVGTVSIGVDAQRGEVMAAVLHRAGSGQIKIIKGPKLIAGNDWWKHAEQYDNVLFSGPALERWSSKAPPHFVLANDSDWFPKASSAGKLAVERLASATFDDVWSLLPIYSRLSAAEEKRHAESLV